jgi:DNA-binding XRE family transcriptional regulator
MNRILYVGRKAKGLTEAQIAKVLQIEEHEYVELEHSLTDVTAQQALKLSKLFSIDAEIFIYTEGRETRLIKYAADEISGYMKNGLLDGMSPKELFGITSMANTALSLSVQLSHSVYQQYELEKDNTALRGLIAELKSKLQV